MTERFVLRGLLLLASCELLLTPFLSAAAPAVAASPETNRPAKVFQPVSPGLVDGRITYISARILEQLHMSRQPLDDSVSTKLLDDYLEALDPQRLHFTQADLAQFEKYRARLDNLTLTSQFIADTTPACEIFNRYMERLQQRVQYSQQLLKKEKFTFTGKDRILINRKEAPYPKDLNEARKIWRERLRYEYLQEKLGKADTKKKKPEAGVTNAAPKSVEAEIVETLQNRYDRTLRTFADWDTQDVLQVYLTTLAHVYDPHSDYMGREQLESFAIGMNLSLFGIGAELLSEDGYCTIRRLMPEGPAEKSKKIKVNDRIVAVGQSNQPPVDVVEMSLSKAVQLIRGPKGTEVRLTIVPADDRSARKVVSLIRDEIKLEEQEAKAKLIEVPAPGGSMRLGVIDLPSFYAPFDPSHTRGEGSNKRTTDDVAKLLRKLKQENVDGVVLDLRRNGGGSLDEAIQLTGLFIKQGPVVQIKGLDSVQVDSDNDPSVVYGGPLVVLTSRFSASASEIVAGALQDYGRALIVGDSATHGKGTVQSVHDLTPYMAAGRLNLTNAPGALKLTIKKFYRASGASTQLKGVNPDIVLPSVFSESKDIGESALDNPLPWDTIPSANYEEVNMVSAFLPELRTRSAARIATDKDFAYIQEDIALFKKMQADKTISLNEQARLKEKHEADARQKARDKERLGRPDPEEKVYEITLKLADKPGLPAPVQKTNNVARVESDLPSAEDLAASAQGTAGLDGVAANPDDENSEDEPKAPPVDPALTEARRVLADYVSMLRGNNVAVFGKNSAPESK